MENTANLKDKMDTNFNAMEKLIDDSFEILKNSPSEKDIIINSWVSHVSKFISYTHKASEMNKNKDIFKAITKALIFGKK